MRERGITSSNKQVYRVEGFTCANCAGKFEHNVKQLPGVADAKVNFAASKITVYGEASVEQLEQAGAFERLKVFPENDEWVHGKATEPTESVSFVQRHSRLLYASLLLGLGYVSLFLNGEQNLVTILLFVSSIGIGGYSLLQAGFSNLLRWDFDMRTLMTVAIVGAALIGEWAEGAVVVILFAISEALERFSMDRARQSIRSLMTIAPKEAVVRRNGQERTIRVQEIAIGDILIVKPGQNIAMDGVVTNGSSTVNQAAITGESIPVVKTAGDEVFAGTLNEDGYLEVKVTKLAKDATIAKIIHLVEEAQAERAPSQAFIDKFARFYTPAIMAVAALVAVFPPMLDGNWFKWLYQGLSVLVVGCPCALVISTPVSIVSAIGNAARQGVLVKGGIYLEQLGAVRAIALDKTGTLTRGVPVVTDIVRFGPLPERELLRIMAALEHRSQHPLASAILRKAEQENITYSDLTVREFVSLTGIGIQGSVDGVTYYAGRPEAIAERIHVRLTPEQEQRMHQLQQEGKTVMAVGTDKQLEALIAAADEARESAPPMVQELRRLGIDKTVMLTGDQPHTAKAIAAGTGLSAYKAELMPQDKLAAVSDLKAVYGSVAMVGDGVNDAPALAAASVGIAMGGAGTDAALETADVVIMGDDLSKLPFAIRLGRKTLAVIQQNIGFALGMKLLALLLVVPGWLTLWIAILSDMGATLLVTLNGLRLMMVLPSR